MKKYLATVIMYVTNKNKGGNLMKKELKGFVIGVIITVMLMSTVAFAGGVKQKIEVALNSINIAVNGKPVKADNILYKGTTYVPLRAISEMLRKDVDWNGDTNTASINDKDLNKADPKDVIGKSDLPYTVRAKNDMAITINSYEASKSGIKLNVTMTNHSSVSDKGKIMLSTYDIYDGKETLKFISMDRVFYDTDYLRAGQSVTGDVIYSGLSHETDTFTLYGKLWQYIDTEEFKITFKVE